MIVSLSLIRDDTEIRLRCLQIASHYLTVSYCVEYVLMIVTHTTHGTTTSLLRCDTSDSRFSARLRCNIIANGSWGNPDLSPSYTWSHKFMLFFRVESVYLLLLFLFSLFYVIYHRPSTKFQCSFIFLYKVHDNL